jgi:hypothetical protein
MALHLVIYLVCTWAALIAGMLAPLYFMPKPILHPYAIYWPIGLPTAFVAMRVPRLVFKYALPARCPVCQGAARLEGHSPLRYRCLACGYVQTSQVDE